MPTLQQRQQIERQKFLKTKPQFQQNNPTTSEKIKYNIADLLGGGANFMNYLAGTVGKFGSNLPADIVSTVSPKVAKAMDTYSGGLLAGTSPKERQQYASKDRLNRANIAAGAAASIIGGELIGAGINKATPYITKGVKNVGKEVLETARPYLTGESKIPMSGYKPKKNLINNGIEDGFKSEINWGKWNEEIPKNAKLMKEYNTIEQAAKAKGTWMKTNYRDVIDDDATELAYKKLVDKTEEVELNKLLSKNFNEHLEKASAKWMENFEKDPSSKLDFLDLRGVDVENVFADLSSIMKGKEKDILLNKKNIYKTEYDDFKGLPEQFVQQKSENFKKAFPNLIKNNSGDAQVNYHGSPFKFNEFKNEVKNGRLYGEGIYTTTSKNRAKEYAKGHNPQLYELYLNAKNKRDVSGYMKKIIDRAEKVVDSADKKYGTNSNEYRNAVEGLDNTLKRLNENKPKIKEGEDFMNFEDIQVTPFKNYPKSMIGNNGMFDMTNPNIYKSLIPAGFFGYGLSQSKKQGGVLKKKYI